MRVSRIPALLITAIPNKPQSDKVGQTSLAFRRIGESGSRERR